MIIEKKKKEKKAKEEKEKEKEKNAKEEKEKKEKQEKEKEKKKKKAKEMDMEKQKEKEKENEKKKQKEKAKAKKKGKKVKVVRCDMKRQYPFEGFNIDGEGPTKLMSSFSQWIKEVLYKHHAKKENKEDHYLANCSKHEFDELDSVVAFLMNKGWFYIMSQPNRCWNDEVNPCSLLYVLFNT
ncbi:protein PXR1-like [Solanum pennellii]|uniref:Protein PXR1-like n=1 Tax=Solanum pennellii TaxID=28526 RepID=A0ABM1VGK2_SOLPN|nr:protein PXR1-like [Solanum pennellii]